MARAPLTDADRQRGRRIGAYLRRVRTLRGQSAQEVAMAAGLSIDTVRSIESGRIASPAFGTIASLADVLAISLDDVGAAAAAAASPASVSAVAP